MKVSEEFPSKYLKASDLNGKQVKVTISHVTREAVGDDDRLVAYFEGKKKGPRSSFFASRPASRRSAANS